jgi:flagellar biosynthesis/type III secretory pathway protein FliH
MTSAPSQEAEKIAREVAIWIVGFARQRDIACQPEHDEQECIESATADILKALTEYAAQREREAIAKYPHIYNEGFGQGIKEGDPRPGARGGKSWRDVQHKYLPPVSHDK